MQNQSQQELENLINNIRTAIVNYEWSPKEISEALIKVMRQRGDRIPEINYIMDMIAAHHSINRHTLIYGTSRYHSEARKLACCLMYYDLELTVDHIAARVFKKKSPYRVQKVISEFRTINPAIKWDRDFKEKYDIFQKKLQAFILDRNNETTQKNGTE